MPSKLSAIVVAYQTPAEVAAAVASLLAQERRPDEIIVVDNGAAEGVSSSRTLDHPLVRTECPAENLGFGGGCNLGVSRATGASLLIINADVVLTATCTSTMLRRLEADPNVAVVGPRVLSGGQLQASARVWPSLRTGMFGRRSVATRLLLRVGHSPADLRPTHQGGGGVDWVSGACMMLRASAFGAVSGFDHEYWMYWEDADLCKRLTDRGWKVVYEPKAAVHHASGASGTSERTIRAFHRSASVFARRYIARNALERRAIGIVLRARSNLVVHMWKRRQGTIASSSR